MPIYNMTTIAKKKVAFKSLLSAAQKLSVEEKQLLWLKFFGNDAIDEMKAFEKALQKKRPVTKKSDKDIVILTRTIRAANGERTKKRRH